MKAGKPQETFPSFALRFGSVASTPISGYSGACRRHRCCYR